MLLASGWLRFHLPSGGQGRAGKPAASSPAPVPSTVPLTKVGGEYGEKVNSRNSQKYDTPAMGAGVPTRLASILLVAGNQQKQRKSVDGKCWLAGWCQGTWDGYGGRHFWHGTQALVFGGKWKVPVSFGCHHTFNVAFIGGMLTHLPQWGERCTSSPIFSDARVHLHSYSSHTNHFP